MNYKLYQKLKKAGFKIKYKGHNTDRAMESITLSELIEACVGKFGGLYRNTNDSNVVPVWTADSWDEGYYGIGHTPKEAVAKLWLELIKNS